MAAVVVVVVVIDDLKVAGGVIGVVEGAGVALVCHEGEFTANSRNVHHPLKGLALIFIYSVDSVLDTNAHLPL